jgi:outer membrane lipopolysaccharide assembly protein LptE/RlpB
MRPFTLTPLKTPTALRRPSLLYAVLRCSLLSLAVLTGCGYHTAGSATHIPANVRTIAVPVFATHTQAFRTNRRVLTENSTDADAVLHGTVLTQTAIPLTYDSTSGETSSYLLTITIKVVLTARDGHILYQNDALSYREQYQSTQDLTGFLQEDPAAVARLSRDFAKTVVSDMLESF